MDEEVSNRPDLKSEINLLVNTSIHLYGHKRGIAAIEFPAGFERR